MNERDEGHEMREFHFISVGVNKSDSLSEFHFIFILVEKMS
jgi:hypothetical protein